MDKWNLIIKPVIDAYQAGKKILSVDVNYKYDPAQKKDEENNQAMKQKRIVQYIQILTELGDNLGQEKK